MATDELQTLLRFFNALANESRLKVLGILANRECSVEELATLLDLKAPTVSHHLSKLKELGLIRMRLDGNDHLHRLNLRWVAGNEQGSFQVFHFGEGSYLGR